MGIAFREESENQAAGYFTFPSFKSEIAAYYSLFDHLLEW